MYAFIIKIKQLMYPEHTSGWENAQTTQSEISCFWESQLLVLLIIRLHTISWHVCNKIALVGVNKSQASVGKYCLPMNDLISLFIQ